MALLNQFCTKHRVWTHTAECMRCMLDSLRDERREERTAEIAQPLPVAPRFQVPEEWRDEMYAAITSGDIVRLDRAIAACDDLDDFGREVLRDACRTAHWALHEGKDADEDYIARIPEEAEPEGLRLWPVSIREALEALSLAVVVAVGVYLALRVLGCPPPPGMP